MKNKVHQNISVFLHNDWWKLGSLVLVGVFAICYASKTKIRYRDNEILHIFIAGENKDNNFNKTLSERINDNTFKEINTTTIKYSDKRFSSAIKTTYGIDCDILLLPESYIKNNNTFLSGCYRFSDAEILDIKNAISPEEYAYYDRAVGFKIYDPNDSSLNNSLINTCYSFDETTYIFVDNTSTNIAPNGDNSEIINVLINLYL